MTVETLIIVQLTDVLAVLQTIIEECGYTNHMLVFKLAHDALFKQASLITIHL